MGVLMRFVIHRSSILELMVILFLAVQWGINDKGQCGTGDCVSREIPSMVKEAFNGTYSQRWPADIFCPTNHYGSPSMQGLLPRYLVVVSIALA